MWIGICFFYLLPLIHESISLSDINKPQPSAKIVGGQNAPNHYPFVLSLQYNKITPSFLFMPGKNWSHFCGATIVRENFFVTAAHCIQNQTISKLSVLAGTTNLSDKNGTRYYVDSCWVHPNYGLFVNDIAVCKIQNTFTFGPTIGPITLSNTSVGGGVNCSLDGWGYITNIRQIPFTLRDEEKRIYLSTITNDECIAQGRTIGPGQICTVSSFMRGPCGGDSGGALQMDSTLVGIVSYGTRVCAISSPDVYTRASEYIEWMTQIMLNSDLNSTANSLASAQPNLIPGA